MINLKTALLLTSVCTLAACSPSTPYETSTSSAPDSTSIERDILTASGDVLGTLSLVDLGEEGTQVTVSISGLEGAGTHAMHFHEFGLCEAPGFTSSGGHKNPMNMDHGKMSPNGPHAGDMMNIEVGSDGTGSLTVINEFVSINGDHGLPALLDDDGTALIIHEKADDYITQPTGAAGGRIGCTVI
ncbi:superoxide dismutase family protein [Glaciecola sp. SC05]|uniref:superoxide dismutase family protein n=1 Tax=Glaciecola sp. SC05 TaxID=1987355 RepID=UPI003529720E